MRLLHVLESSGVYGKERVVLELMDAQRRQGLTPVLGVIGRGTGAARQAVLLAARQRGFEALPLTVEGLKDPARVCSAILGAGAGIVHAHDYKSSLVLVPFRRFGPLPPLIRTLHGYTTITRFSRMQVYEWLDRAGLRWHDAVVAVSATMRRRIGGELVVIENGISPPQAAAGHPDDPDLAAARAFCREALVLGSLARLSPEKNLVALIEAVAALNEGGVRSRLIVIGEGRCRAALERRAAELGAAQIVRLPGFKADVWPWLELFDLYLQPSWTEGLPIALLEAMHASVPLLVTPVGGMNEILAAGAARRIPFAGDALAREVRRLHTTPAGRASLAAVAGRATTLARERYSSESMARGYGALYERVLRRGRAGGS